MTRKWDVLVLTVGSEKQKDAALKQLEELDLTDTVETVAVMADYPPGVKIGSGGATLQCLFDLYLTYGDNLLQKRVLLLHTGGYSQRLLHASAMGKAFMLVPSGKTFLEIKIRTFESVLEQMKPGVLICSADTMEHVGTSKFDHNADLILFGHESTLEVASQHGVYSVNDEGQLVFVLQKPSWKEMHEKGVVKNELAITDSCYILGSDVVRALIELRKTSGMADCEICCYGDFLRPLGLRPTTDWFAAEGTSLSAWQRALTDIMKHRNTVVVNLGPDSFYHLGTTAELYEYFFNSSSFIEKFIGGSTTNTLFSMVDVPSQISSDSLVEWSVIGSSCRIEPRCTVSGIVCDAPQNTTISEGTIVVTLCVDTNEHDKGYITAMFHRDTCLKTVSTTLCWFGHEIKCAVPTSLWNHQLFTVCENPQESLVNTMRKVKNGVKEDDEGAVSIADALRMVNIEETLRRRAELRLLSAGLPAQ